jgi:hypothetical protein
MSNHIYLIAGAAFLLAGAAHGAEPARPEARASQTTTQTEAVEPTTSIATLDATDKLKAENTMQELDPAAKPVYYNGGYFGSLGE